MYRTQNGHDLLEAVSALQKSVRRADELSAGYWGFELWPRFSKLLWQRLVTISVEDVGLGNPEMILLIRALKENFFEFERDGKDGGQRLCIGAAVLLLCRSPKSRTVDHYQCVITQRRIQKGWKLDPPDYSVDMHTLRGRRQGRSWQHFFQHGAHLENRADVRDCYESEAKSLWSTSKKVTPSKKTKWTDSDELSLFDEEDL